MDMTRATRAIARDVIDRATTSRYGEMWEEYPEIGERDWYRITAHVETLLSRTRLHRDEINAAYEFLSARAENKD